MPSIWLALGVSAATLYADDTCSRAGQPAAFSDSDGVCRECDGLMGNRKPVMERSPGEDINRHGTGQGKKENRRDPNGEPAKQAFH